ncbi:MAG: hypothetical protein M1828_001342 [Chrysothrix sp. TS-e1954]|nr:MAG: hypothetical protein M1828_001342 [Chrysothrix sp. TS-e1954]
MEIAAGAVAAEQVVSTTIEGTALAGYAIAQPTLPLKAAFTRIATVPASSEPDSIARSSHTVNLLDGDVYIFGGLVAQDLLAGNEVHVVKMSNLGRSQVEYRTLPSLAQNDGEPGPCARAGHTTVAAKGRLVMYGGYSDMATKAPLDEEGRVSVFDPTTSRWTLLAAASKDYPICHSHASTISGDKLYIHGGITSASSTKASSDTWSFDLNTCVWTKLPDLPAGSTAITPTTFPNMTVVHNNLYVIAASSDLSSLIFALPLTTNATSNEQWPQWSHIEIPTNPLTPGPSPRHAAGLHPITTGVGRTYLLLMFGNHNRTSSQGTGQDPDFCSDLWTLQLPSTAISPAHAKDAAREKLGASSHKAEWADVKIVAKEEKGQVTEGSAHPGPRAWFASAVADDWKSVVLWGGLNAKGEREGDGWLVELKAA